MFDTLLCGLLSVSLSVSYHVSFCDSLNLTNKIINTWSFIVERFAMKKYEPKLQIALFTSQDNAILNKLNLNIEINIESIPKNMDLTVTETTTVTKNLDLVFVWNFPPTQNDWIRLEARLSGIRDGRLEG